jgi:dynein heavy chain
MNPGYAGRAELPESLKVLFRPCAMVVPNMHMICEIMLAAEGFSESKMLSRKFMILYELCEDLLSKQRHYDFKLRAVKTTLNVAGAMKRAAPDMSEDKTLLRALRDFNVGKLVDADYGIFFGLLEDLFPKTLDLVPRARDEKFEGLITQAAKSLNFQCEEQFALKITQLREICEVRWSVFLLGPAGSGKTTLLKTLAATQRLNEEKTRIVPINPKSVTRNELYGYISPATREWKDGVAANVFNNVVLPEPAGPNKNTDQRTSHISRNCVIFNANCSSH